MCNIFYMKKEKSRAIDIFILFYFFTEQVELASTFPVSHFFFTQLDTGCSRKMYHVIHTVIWITWYNLSGTPFFASSGTCASFLRIWIPSECWHICHYILQLHRTTTCYLLIGEYLSSNTIFRGANNCTSLILVKASIYTVDWQVYDAARISILPVFTNINDKKDESVM